MVKIEPISACTKYPNTPETDQQEEVLHIVNFTNGFKLEVMARDPMDALDKARVLQETVRKFFKRKGDKWVTESA